MNDDQKTEIVFDPSTMTEKELEDLRDQIVSQPYVDIREQYWNSILKDADLETAQKILADVSETTDEYLRTVRINQDTPKSLVKRIVELAEADLEEEQQARMNDPNPCA